MFWRSRILTILRLALIIISSGCLFWFDFGSSAAADNKPALVSPPTQKYVPGTPSWVPLIDTCMATGGRRADCIEALPPEELQKLEAWEQQNSQGRKRALSTRTFGSGGSFDWNAILRLPREDAIALAYLSQYSQYRPGILNLVFGFWATEDPAAAHARLLLVSNDFETTGIEIQVIKSWMQTDAPSAIAAAASSNSPEIFEMALSDYAHQDPEAGLTIAQEYGTRLGPEAWTAVITGMASRNPQLAAQYIASLGEDGTYLIDAFIDNLIVADPEQTMNWLLAYFPDDTSHYDGIASFFYIRSPVDAFAYLDQMHEGAGKDTFAEALCRARSTNEASRAISSLDQPPPGYDGGICEHRRQMDSR